MNASVWIMDRISKKCLLNSRKSSVLLLTVWCFDMEMERHQWLVDWDRSQGTLHVQAAIQCHLAMRWFNPASRSPCTPTLSHSLNVDEVTSFGVAQSASDYKTPYLSVAQDYLNSIIPLPTSQSLRDSHEKTIQVEMKQNKTLGSYSFLTSCTSMKLPNEIHSFWKATYEWEGR